MIRTLTPGSAPCPTSAPANSCWPSSTSFTNIARKQASHRDFDPLDVVSCDGLTPVGFGFQKLRFHQIVVGPLPALLSDYADTHGRGISTVYRFHLAHLVEAVGNMRVGHSRVDLPDVTIADAWIAQVLLP